MQKFTYFGEFTKFTSPAQMEKGIFLVYSGQRLWLRRGGEGVLMTAINDKSEPYPLRPGYMANVNGRVFNAKQGSLTFPDTDAFIIRHENKVVCRHHLNPKRKMRPVPLPKEKEEEGRSMPTYISKTF